VSKFNNIQSYPRKDSPQLEYSIETFNSIERHSIICCYCSICDEEEAREEKTAHINHLFS